MKKFLAILCVLALSLSVFAASAETVKATQAWKIALITMDSIDQHWVKLNEGAQAKATELGVTVTFMSPNTKDDAQQIECVNNAVAGGYNAIMVAANGPDAISSALKEAQAAGVKIVYVDSPANVPAEATFSTDNQAAGKTAGETMIAALTAAGVTEGSIGIVNVNAATDSTVKREAGFRSAFDGTKFTILETQYGEGDAAKSQTIAENYITQGVVGIFGANEGSTTGTGNAIKDAGKAVIGVGFDKSDAILGLIADGYLLATMAQNPDVMGAKGVEAAVQAADNVGDLRLVGGVVDGADAAAGRVVGGLGRHGAVRLGDGLLEQRPGVVNLVSVERRERQIGTPHERHVVFAHRRVRLVDPARHRRDHDRGEDREDHQHHDDLHEGEPPASALSCNVHSHALLLCTM